MSAKITDTRAENAPLLGPRSQSKPGSYSADSDAATITINRDVEADITNADDEALLADLQKPEPEPWTVWSFMIYGVLVAFLLFFVGIVIKGFVDVGEQDPKDPKKPDVHTV